MAWSPIPGPSVFSHHLGSRFLNVHIVHAEFLCGVRFVGWFWGIPEDGPVRLSRRELRGGIGCAVCMDVVIFMKAWQFQGHNLSSIVIGP